MFKYNGEEHKLPIKTMSLNDKIEAVNNAKTTKEAYTKMMDFVVAGLGKDKVDELLGTHNVNKVDLTELNILSNAIVNGYDDKVAEKQLERADRVANSDAIDRLIQVGKSINQLDKIKQ